MSTDKKPVAIYGSGMLGIQVYHVLKAYYAEQWDIVGFIDDTKPSGEVIVDGICTVGSLALIAASEGFNASNISIVMAIGYGHLDKKYDAFANAKALGYHFETVIHPHAFIEKSVTVGEGNIFLAGVVIDQHVEIGDINYFDIATKVGECSKIGDSNYLAAGATLAGFVQVGQSNFVGLDTTVVSFMKIGHRNFINAKTLITSDIDDDNKVIQVHQVRCMKVAR